MTVINCITFPGANEDHDARALPLCWVVHNMTLFTTAMGTHCLTRNTSTATHSLCRQFYGLVSCFTSMVCFHCFDYCCGNGLEPCIWIRQDGGDSSRDQNSYICSGSSDERAGTFQLLQGSLLKNVLVQNRMSTCSTEARPCAR